MTARRGGGAGDRVTHATCASTRSLKNRSSVVITEPSNQLLSQRPHGESHHADDSLACGYAGSLPSRADHSRAGRSGVLCGVRGCAVALRAAPDRPGGPPAWATTATMATPT